MRESRGVLVAGTLLLTGCVGQMYQQVDLGDGRRVYVGMTPQQLTDTLGHPTLVGTGASAPHASLLQNRLISPGYATVEWSWKMEHQTVVAWMDFGQVRFLAVIPDEELEKKKAAQTTESTSGSTPLRDTSGSPGFYSPAKPGQIGTTPGRR